MGCQTCGSERILCVSSKSSDLNFVEYNGIEHDGYLPYDLGVGGGDYVEIEVCMECGQLQGEWPKDHDSILESMGVAE